MPILLVLSNYFFCLVEALHKGDVLIHGFVELEIKLELDGESLLECDGSHGIIEFVYLYELNMHRLIVCEAFVVRLTNPK